MSKHLAMVDLYNNGVDYEVVVVQLNKHNGDLYFIRVMDLDEIDRDRMRRILNRRDAERLEVWDLLDTITLNNGVNALDYFQQLVLMRTQSGEIMRPDASRRGSRLMGGSGVRVQAAKPAQTEQAPAPVKQGKRAPKADAESSE